MSTVSVRKCDRCGALIQNELGMELKVKAATGTVVGHLGEAELDLCGNCRLDFDLFMERKG